MTILIVISSVSASSIFVFYEDNTENVALSSQSMLFLPDSRTIREESTLVSVKDESAVGETEIGKFALYPKSQIIVYEGSDEIILYLINGSFLFDSKENSSKSILLYTPTTKTKLETPGFFFAETSPSAEVFINRSEDTLSSYDFITERSYEIPPESKIDYLDSDRIAPITPEEAELSIPLVKKAASSQEESAVSTATNEVSEKLDNREESQGEKRAKEVLPPIPESAVSSSVLEDLNEEEESENNENDDLFMRGNTVLRSGSVRPKNTFSFSIGVVHRAYASNESGKSVRLSVLPAFSFGRFSLALNLEPFSLLTPPKSGNSLDWISYCFNIVGNLSFSTQNQLIVLNMSRGDNLPGDMVGLYEGVNKFYLGSNYPLEFNFEVNSSIFDMRLYSSDLTFGRYEYILGERGSRNQASESFLGAEMRFYFSRRYPSYVSLGLLSLLVNYDVSASALFPMLSFYFPFIFTDGDFGVRLTASTRLLPNSLSVNPIYNGYMLSIELPVKFSDFSMDLGAFLSYGGRLGPDVYPTHYLGIGTRGYKPIMEVHQPLLSLVGKLSYDGDIAGFGMTILGDIRLTNMTFVPENSLLDTYLYLNIFNTHINAGMRVQNIISSESYLDNMLLYASLEFGNENFGLTAMGGINSITYHDFFLSFEGNAHIYDTEKGRIESPKELRKYRFNIDFGYSYLFNDKKNIFSINPEVAIDFLEHSSVSIQAPINLTIGDRGIDIVPSMGRNWLLFGSNETSRARRIFSAVTDLFTLINHMNLGSQSESYAYLRLDREYSKNNLLFSDFSSSGYLSLNAGINAPYFAFDLFLDSIESPHLGEIKASIRPMKDERLVIELLSTAEFYIKENNDFSLIFHPAFNMSFELGTKHVSASLFAVGSITSEKNGNRVSNRYFYEDDEKSLLPTIMGMDISLKWRHFGLTLYAGAENGSLSLTEYNTFTSLYNSVTLIAEGGGIQLKPFIKADMSLDFNQIDIDLSYSIPEISKNILSSDSDLFSFSLGWNATENLSIILSYKRMGLISLINEKNFRSFLNDTRNMYQIGFSIEAGRITLSALLSSFPLYWGYNINSEFVNMNPEYNRELGITPSFTLNARISY